MSDSLASQDGPCFKDNAFDEEDGGNEVKEAQIVDKEPEKSTILGSAVAPTAASSSVPGLFTFGADSAPPKPSTIFHFGQSSGTTGWQCTSTQVLHPSSN